MLEPWKNPKKEHWFSQPKYKGIGVLDGGFLDTEICQRLRWIVPTPSPTLHNQPEERQPFLKAMNNVITIVQGPAAEGKFADQVVTFKSMAKLWRFSTAYMTR